VLVFNLIEDGLIYVRSRFLKNHIFFNFILFILL